VLQTALRLVPLFLCFSTTVFAQGIRVSNDNTAAFRCFVEADIASTVEMVGVSTDNLEPCNVAIDQYGLSDDVRAATFANRGILHAANGSLAEALSDYDEALMISPSLAEVYVSRGILYHFLRDFQRAINDYSLAIEMNVSNMHIAYFDRGMAYEELEMLEEAKNDYSKALESKSDWPPARVRLRWVSDKLENGPSR
jgi:tetratricopeptide (TPR) repeat protein